VSREVVKTNTELAEPVAEPSPNQAAPQPGPLGGGEALVVAPGPPRYELAAPEEEERVSLTPGQLAWRQLRKNRFAMTGGSVLIILYLTAIFADFLSPYPIDLQRRSLFYHPPTPLVWRDAAGRFSLRPHVGAMRRDVSQKLVSDPATRAPVRFFVQGHPYRLLGLIPTRVHLFGTDERAPIFVLGTDSLGRDVFSRMLRGSQISLSVGLIAIVITLTLALFVGGLSGYYGGRIDNVLMRLCEVLQSLPGFFLLLALAAGLPPSLSPQLTYLLIIVILSFVGWAGLARVIRGIALSAREREYVEAAKALGVSDLKIVRRHILPNTFTYAIVQATLSIPGYILSEAGLSYLGLGIREPMPSWGNMLAAAQNLEVLTQYTWILAPGYFIFVTVLAFNFLGDGLRDALDPKLRK
jgi:peptide/nickel transport system permease protein